MADWLSALGKGMMRGGETYTTLRRQKEQDELQRQQVALQAALLNEQIKSAGINRLQDVEKFGIDTAKSLVSSMPEQSLVRELPYGVAGTGGEAFFTPDKTLDSKKLDLSALGPQLAPGAPIPGGTTPKLGNEEVKKALGPAAMITDPGQETGEGFRTVMPEDSKSKLLSEKLQSDYYKALLRDTTQRRGQDVTARGQDVRADVATRGQDMGQENVNNRINAMIQIAALNALKGSTSPTSPDNPFNQMGNMVIPAGPPGQRNESALEGLTPRQADMVKGLADYRVKLPPARVLASPEWQEVMRRVVVYDPTFDEKLYGARQSLQRDFRTGKAAVNVRSINTLIGHLESLNTAGTEVDKGLVNEGSTPLLNRAQNFIRTQSGDDRTTRFGAAANAVESELASLFKGMGATDQEIKAWREQVNAYASPEQKRGFLEMAADLMLSRLEALQNQYSTGLGKPSDQGFLTPKNEKILDDLIPGWRERSAYWGNGANVWGNQNPAPAAPPQNQRPADVVIGPDGRIRR